jgi:AcrR family transcriptional regulator
MSQGNRSDQKRRGRAPHQLPPGRHGLSRTYVESNQRARMLDAVIDVVSFEGYAAMSVEDIVSAAGVSRRTFYDHFAGKEDAFMQAFDQVGSELLRHVGAAYESSATFADGVVAGLRAFMEFIASEPRYADMCIVEVLAAGPTAIERRNAVMKSFAELIHRGATRDGVRAPELTSETIIGGIYEVVYSRVLAGRTSELPKLLPDLAYSMVLPYLGHKRADRELRQLATAAAA